MPVLISLRASPSVIVRNREIDQAANTPLRVNRSTAGRKGKKSIQHVIHQIAENGRSISKRYFTFFSFMGR